MGQIANTEAHGEEIEELLKTRINLNALEFIDI